MAEVHQLPGTVAQIDEAQPDPLPSRDELADLAFDVWAMLRATLARLHEMDGDGPIGFDEVAELSRLIRCASNAALAVGAKAV